jgi:hypothetical protein
MQPVSEEDVTTLLRWQSINCRTAIWWQNWQSVSYGCARVPSVDQAP